MKIIHRFGLRVSESQRRHLESLGVKVPAGQMLGGRLPLVALDIEEGHPQWLSLERLLRDWKAMDSTRTEFSVAEISAARWARMVAWHHGYPQPDEDAFGYRKTTYDSTRFCEECGIGLVQTAPFQMNGEPRWGRNSLLQLFWVFDEMFATADAWSSVFQPLGVACRPVVSRQGAELKTVVQLLVDEECEVSSNGLAFEACTRCHRPKYTPMDRGPLPTLKCEPSCAIARTSAYFGSGGEAYKLILVSQELIHAILAAKLRGVHFTPCLQDVEAQEWASRSNRGPSPSSQ